MKLLFLPLLLCMAVNAQITFEKGYLINNKGEKINCFIKNVDWKDNPTKFEYKTDLNESKSATAVIGDVSEFVIEGESKFKRFVVNIERSEVLLNNLTENKNPIWQQETLFLKALVEGNASLYSYSESNILKFFYVTETIPIEQLVAITYKSKDGNIITNNAFRQQLFNHVKRDDMTDNDFKTLEYTTNSLIKHFSKYNYSNEKKVDSYLTKKVKNIVNIRISLGLSPAQLSISDSDPYNNLSTDVSKTAYRFGAELEYVLPFNKNKWAILINPTYEKFNPEKTYTITVPGFPPHDVEHTVRVKYTAIEVPIGLRYYMFLNKNSKFFINALYSVNFSPNSSISFDNGTPYTISGNFNAVFGLGYTFKDRYSLELRANSPRELLGDYIDWSAKYTGFSIQFSYKVF